MPIIPLKRFASMDPYILVSALNMQLRDEYSSLEELCASQEIPIEELKAKLKKKEFTYDEATRQFK